jgi:hypothetical protein
MGVVYEAEDLKLGRRIALKLNSFPKISPPICRHWSGFDVKRVLLLLWIIRTFAPSTKLMRPMGEPSLQWNCWRDRRSGNSSMGGR